MKIIKISLLILLIIIVTSLVIMFSAIGIMEIKTRKMNDDYSSFFADEKSTVAVLINNIDVIDQKVTCGYAVIEMFSTWTGGNVTEASIDKQNNKIVTATAKGFCKEMNKQIPEYKTTMHTYLKSSELLQKVYISLTDGIPVPFQWAAKYGEEWTLHYSLIIGMDALNDIITIANPYGYIEKISFEEFLDRTSYRAYENLPIFMKLGFAFGFFDKNTIFIAEKV